MFAAQLFVEDFVADVGPKFFDDVKEGVESKLLSPFGSGVAEGAVGGGVVEVGDARGDGIASDLGGIELIAAVIAARDDLAADSVSGAAPESAGAFDEVAWILVKSDWKNGLGHEVADGLVGESATIIFAEAGGAGSERRVLGLGHVDSSEDARNEKGRRIK